MEDKELFRDGKNPAQAVLPEKDREVFRGSKVFFTGSKIIKTKIFKFMNEEEIKKDLIGYCRRRIMETGLEEGYYHDMIKIFEKK